MTAPAFTIGGSDAIAWAAGLFEGEGSFYGHGYRIRASVVTTDEDVLRRFAAVVGVGNVYSRQDRRDGRKPSWKWETTTSNGFKRVCSLFAPYLGERRRERALALLRERALAILARISPRSCANCGAVYLSSRADGKHRLYCSGICKTESYWRRRLARGDA